MDQSLDADRKRHAAVEQKKPQAMKMLSDPQGVLNYLNERRVKKHKPPYSQAQMERFLAGSDRRMAERETAAALKENMDAIEQRRGGRSSPKGIGNLYRAIPAFLEPEDREGAKERNDEFYRSLETEEGVHRFFYKAVDYIEQKGEGIFWERSPEKVLDAVEKDPEYLQFAFVVRAIGNYANDNADPRLADSVQERITAFESAQSLSNLVTNMANPVHAALGGMTMEDCMDAVSLLQGGNADPLDVAASNIILDYLNNKMGLELFMQQDEKAMAGQQLAELGLLNGDFSFRNAEGQRLTHENGLEAIGKGETVTLERYDSRNAGAGLSYSVTMREGTVLLSDAAPCSREAVPDKQLDEKMLAITRTFGAQVSSGTRCFGEGGQRLAVKEAIQELYEGRSILLRQSGRDSILFTPREAQNGMPALEQQSMTAEQEADYILASETRTVNFLSDLQAKNGAKPLSEERKQALLDNGGRKEIQAAAAEAAEKSRAWTEDIEKNRIPRELDTLKRVARAFLKTPDQPGAEEYNRTFIQSLETPEGRRDLFNRALDRMEQEGEGVFLTTDDKQKARILREKPELIELGWVFGTAMRDYCQQPEMGDVDPDIRNRLKECGQVIEMAGRLKEDVQYCAMAHYPVLGGLTAEENQSLLTAKQDTPVEKAVFRALAPELNARSRKDTVAVFDPVRALGTELAEKGLMKGSLSFRDGDGKRMGHRDALDAVLSGKQVRLEQYESRRSGEGLSYELTMADGKLAVGEGKACSRSAIPDAVYDPKLAELGNALKTANAEAFMDADGVREENWTERLRRFADGEEACIRKTDGSLAMVRAVPDVNDPEKTAIQERRVTVQELYAEKIVNDSEKLLDFFSQMLVGSGQEPFSEERKRELLSDHSRDELQKSAEAAQKKRDELAQLSKLYPCPEEVGSLRRMVNLFLEPLDKPDADAHNRALVESVKTPEGRRELFYRALDYLEQEGEGRFMERDPQKLLELVAEKPAYGEIGFVVKSTLLVYADSDEGMDLDPQLMQSMNERLAVWEEGGDLSNNVTFMARKAFPMLAGMTEEETLAVMTAFNADKTPEEIAVVMALGNAVQERLGYRSDNAGIPLYRVGKQLEEAGLLTGDVVFRDDAGKTMDHRKALEQLADGQSVTLEQYPDRKTPEGMSYRVTLGADGPELQAEGCSREIVPDRAYDARKFDIAKALTQMNRRTDMTLRDSEGNKLGRREAVAQLAAGQTLTVTRYQSIKDYMGQQEKLSAAPNTAGLVSTEKRVCTRTVDLAGEARNPAKQLAELEKLQAVLKKSDPFYVNNSSEFNKLMSSLDKAVRFQKDPEKAAQKPAGTMQQLYADLDAKVDAYLRMKPDKMKQRTDADERGHLRFDAISSLKSITKPEHTGRIVQGFERELAQVRASAQEAAPRQKQREQGGPQR